MITVEHEKSEEQNVEARNELEIIAKGLETLKKSLNALVIRHELCESTQLHRAERCAADAANTIRQVMLNLQNGRCPDA